MAQILEGVRYFELTGNTFIQETVTWKRTFDEDPRGVSLSGETGKFVWAVASNPCVSLPSTADPAYWDYYSLPLLGTVVGELTESEYQTIMADRVEELRQLKSA